MTDAAVSVTQSVVEQFAERYLRSVGCDVEKRGDKWDVTVPGDVESELLLEDVTLICSDADEDGVEPLHPESSFFQRLLSEAGERTPTGKITIGADDVELQTPEWLQESHLEVRSVNFTPYYDRKAIVVLFRIRIETVSEYQTELLRTVAVDTQSDEILPPLERTFLEIAASEKEVTSSGQTETEADDVRQLLDITREQLIERVQETVDRVHQDASRAADAEVEEYRQMQQQRIGELEEKHSRLASKIDELSGQTSSDDESERVEALKERKELKAEYEDIDSELADLRHRRDQGFPERQREIRQRHALDIRIKPVTLTEVVYERGEIGFEVASEEKTGTVTLGYGSGVGVTEEVGCASCGESFDGERPLYRFIDGLRCEVCAN